MSLILPPDYLVQQRRSKKVHPQRFRGYARHIPCAGEAFWFTRFGKAWFDFDLTEIFFEDGQVKLKNKDISEYHCPHCNQHFKSDGSDLKLIKIIQNDEAEHLHREMHLDTTIGDICKSCGKVRTPGNRV